MKISKILFLVIISITLATGPVYAASKGKGEEKEKAKSKEKVGEPKGGTDNGNNNASNNRNNNVNNNRSNNGGGGGNSGYSKKNQPSNGRSSRGTSKPRERKKLIESAKKQAAARANRPAKDVDGKGLGNTSRATEKSAIGTARRRGAAHINNKDTRIYSLLKALEKARWSHNSHDGTSGQGNKGRPDRRPPYGFDKVSGREKSKRGRPFLEKQAKGALLDLSGIVGIEFNIQDSYLNFLKGRLAYYQSYAQTNHYMTRWVAFYQSAIGNHLNTYGNMVRINKEDTINYTITFSPPKGLEGKTLRVTTSLTSLNDYKHSYTRNVYDPATDSWRSEKPTIDYRAGQVVMEQTQEVVLGPDNTLSFTYDPPPELAGTSGLSANLSVTVTEPVSGQSYKISYDRQLYLYRSPYGKISNTKTGEPIVGAKITIHFEDGSKVALDKASNPTASNPQITDATGRYDFKLETNRKYYITVSAPGYKDYVSEIFSEKWQVLREDITLIPIEKIASGN